MRGTHRTCRAVQSCDESGFGEDVITHCAGNRGGYLRGIEGISQLGPPVDVELLKNVT